LRSLFVSEPGNAYYDGSLTGPIPPFAPLRQPESQFR